MSGARVSTVSGIESELSRFALLDIFATPPNRAAVCPLIQGVGKGARYPYSQEFVCMSALQTDPPKKLGIPMGIEG